MGGSDPTITAGDSVKLGDGADIFAITATGAAAAVVAGVTLEGVETVRISDTNTVSATVNMAGVTGVETLESFGSAGAATSFTNVGAIADLKLANTSGTGTTSVAYTSAASTGTNVQNITLDNAAASGTTSISSVEVVNITASGNSSLNGLFIGSGVININAADDTSVNLTATAGTFFTTAPTISAAESAGDVTLTVNYGQGEIAVTGGAGDDVFNTGSGTLGLNDSLDGGDGTDTIRFVSAGGAAGTAVTAVASTLASITSIESVEFQAENADNGGAEVDSFSIDMDTLPGVESILLDANDLEDVNTFRLTDISATQMGAVSAQVAFGATIEFDAKDGTGTSDAAVVNASLGTTSGTLTITDVNNNIESLTINASGNAAQTIAITNGDFTGSVAADATLTVTGGAAGRAMTITGNLSSDTVDFSGVASDVTATFAAAGHTITGGAGDDTFNMGTTFGSTDSIDGGDGEDTVAITPATSIARPGTITNVENLELGASANVTISATNITGLTDLVLSNAAGLDGFVVTLQNLSGISTITHNVADAAAVDGADDGNGVTITNGFTGSSDALSLVLVNAGTNAGPTVVGAMNFAGLENLTVSAVGGADNDTATVGGITASGLTTLTVTSSGFNEDAVNIILGTVSDGGNDEMTSFTAATSVTGVSVTLADMGPASTILGSDLTDTIILTGSTGDDLSLDSGDGADQITLASGTDRVLITTGTGDVDIFFAGGDDHTITLGTGANVLDFDAAADTGVPGTIGVITSGVIVTGFGANDDIRPDADTDTALNIVASVTAAIDSDLFGGDITVFTMDASVTGAVVAGVAGPASFTSTANVKTFLDLIFADATTAADKKGMVVINDGTNSYVYAANYDDGTDAMTEVTLVAQISDYLVNSTNIVL